MEHSQMLSSDFHLEESILDRADESTTETDNVEY